MPDDRRYRVLIAAEACNPEWVSVPLVGWSHYAAVAKVADAHLVTQVRNRPALLRAGLEEGKDFTAVDSEAIAKPVYKLGEVLAGGKGTGWTARMAVNAISQPAFEHGAWKALGGRVRAGEFDAVHQLTPLSPTLPPRLAMRCKSAGVPFVWGPINGGVPWPVGFGKARRREKEWLSYVRGAYKLVPGYRRARRDSAAILIASRDTWGQMPEAYRDRCLYLPENAIDPARFGRSTADRPSAADAVRDGKPIRAVFVGRLVAYKGADVLLDAAAELIRARKLQVDVIGDGPEMAGLRYRIERDRLAHGVNLLGWVKHDRVQDHLAAAHLMPFPSIREFGGGVALEGMALGVVPIVPDYGGLGELVTPDTGWLVPMPTTPAPGEARDTLVARFRDAITSAVENPETIDARVGPARRRVAETFTWDAKAQQTLRVYDWVTGRADKPDWTPPPRATAAATATVA